MALPTLQFLAGLLLLLYLLSFVLFDEEFVQALLEAGAADACRWLARHPRFWCADAAHDLHVGTVDGHAAREQLALDEWRSLRRR